MKTAKPTLLMVKTVANVIMGKTTYETVNCELGVTSVGRSVVHAASDLPLCSPLYDGEKKG